MSNHEWDDRYDTEPPPRPPAEHAVRHIDAGRRRGTGTPPPPPGQGWGPGDPPQGWGQQQPPPGYHHYPPQAPEPRNGLGIAAIILGLAGMVLGLVPLTGWLAVIVGITGAALGLAGAGRIRKQRATNRKTTWAGIGASVVAVGLGIWGIVLFFGAVDQLGEDLEDLGGGEVDAAEAAEAVPAGTLVEVGDWRVAVQPATLDAWPAIQAANQFNEAPAQGVQYVMARADVAYIGAESGTPWLDLRFRVLGGKGNTFDSSNSCGVLPSPLDDVGEMVGGATGAGNVCVAVPADQLQGAVWVVEETLSIGEDTTVTVALS